MNEEKTLPFFLDSLTDQLIKIRSVCCGRPLIEFRLFPFELVVVDGDSRDRSRDLIDAYRDRIPITGLIETARNMGIVRNRGGIAARGQILFFSNSDTRLPENLLGLIHSEFRKDPDLAALSGRTLSLNGGLLSSVGYTAFDFLRWLFCKMAIFSPSGNFLAIRSSVFYETGGFRNLQVNEDGEYGLRLAKYAREKRARVKFSWNLQIWHHAKRFRGNPLRALFFYLYIFGNFHPLLKRILRPIQRKSSREFSGNREEN